MEAVNDSLYELGINSNERWINCKYNLLLELSSYRDVFNLVTTSRLYNTNSFNNKLGLSM